MKIVSLNIGKPEPIKVSDRIIYTGIFKKPINEPIYLGKQDVLNDHVIDRQHHGGFDKACYIFGYNHYPYWQNLYPQLDFDYGMFGENITLDNLDENTIQIGDVFKLGEAIIQVTEPRQPCFKLGYKFQNQAIVKQFSQYYSSGIYVRILKEGCVNINDAMVLMETHDESITVAKIYELLFSKTPDKIQLEMALKIPSISQNLKANILKKLG
ncbi:MAG: MOSC domain-containing protein [Bacteroidia bacterium]